ncbi:hypothetical protein Bbelb_050100 [Branchiostoma belcheri]|nr:hypothetical protein Bbelb_050100 [Branchiostoma belcheri]
MPSKGKGKGRPDVTVISVSRRKCVCVGKKNVELPSVPHARDRVAAHPMAYMLVQTSGITEPEIHPRTYHNIVPDQVTVMIIRSSSQKPNTCWVGTRGTSTSRRSQDFKQNNPWSRKEETSTDGGENPLRRSPWNLEAPTGVLEFGVPSCFETRDPHHPEGVEDIKGQKDHKEELTGKPPPCDYKKHHTEAKHSFGLFLENMQDAVKEAGPANTTMGPMWAAKIAARVKAVAEDLFKSAAAIVDDVLLEEPGDSPCPSLRKPEHLARAANRHRQKLRPTEPKDMTRITSQRLSSERMCGLANIKPRRVKAKVVAGEGSFMNIVAAMQKSFPGFHDITPDKRFSEKDLKWHKAATEVINPSVKLGRLKKYKLADVDSDTPVFVEAFGDQGSQAEVNAITFFLKTPGSVNWKHEVFTTLSNKEYSGVPFGQKDQASQKLTHSFKERARRYQVNDDGALIKHGKLVLVEEEFQDVMKRYHDNAGHPGMTTLKRTVRNVPVSHNQPISVNRTFKRLGIDFTMIRFHDDPAVPKRKVLYAIDYFSRFAWAWIMNEGTEVATEVARCLLKLCLSLGIVWEELQSDNGSEFISHVVRELMKALGVKVILASPRSPTTGGRFERGIQSIKTKVSVILAQGRQGGTRMSADEALQKALYDYNNNDMEVALTEAESVLEGATVASLVAEVRVSTTSEESSHTVMSGNIGYLKLDVRERRSAGGTDRRQVRVKVLDVQNNMLSLEVLNDQGQTTGLILKRKYHVSQLFLERESQQQTGSESGMGSCRHLNRSQRAMAGRILSACMSSKSLLFYAADREADAPTTFSRRGDIMLVEWFKAMQKYMWRSVPPHLQTAFQLGVTLMLVNAARHTTLKLQCPADCLEDILPYLREITKFELPHLAADADGKISEKLVPVALTAFLWPMLKGCKLQDLSVYLRVPVSHKCDLCLQQRPMWQYWRCATCSKSCCMECTCHLLTGHAQHDHPPDMQEDIADTRGPNRSLQQTPDHEDTQDTEEGTSSLQLCPLVGPSVRFVKKDSSQIPSSPVASLNTCIMSPLRLLYYIADTRGPNRSLQQTPDHEDTQDTEEATTDVHVREVTLVEAVLTLDGRHPTKPASGQKGCSCCKIPVCNNKCSCRKGGRVCTDKCKCAKRSLDCQNSGQDDGNVPSGGTTLQESSGVSTTAAPASGVSTTAAPGVSTTAAYPGVSTTAAPGVSTTAAPGVSTTAAPGVSTTAAPGVSTTAAPGVSTTAAPGVSTTAAPGVSTTAAPGVSTTPAYPGVSTTAAPGVSTTAAPGVSTTAAPGVSTTAAQGVSTTAAQGVSTTAAYPGVSTTAAPGVSTTAAPGVSTTAAYPGVSTTAAPGVSTTAAPGVSTTAAPGVSTTAAPGVSTTAAYQGVSTTAAPGVSTTAAPGVSTTAAPGVSTTAAQGVSTTAAYPGVSTTAAPGVSTTAAPGVSTTAAYPGVSTTAAPGVSTTAAPGVSTTAAYPGVSTTAAPGVSTTAAPGVSTTAAPGVSTTAAPGVSTTAAPGVSTTAAPGVSTTAAQGVSTTAAYPGVPLLQDAEVSIDKAQHFLLGPEVLVGETPPVLSSQHEDSDSSSVSSYEPFVATPDMLFGECDLDEMKNYFNAVKPYLSRLAKGEIPDNERHSLFFGKDEEGLSTRSKLRRQHFSGAFTEDQVNTVGVWLMKEVEVPLQQPLLMEYRVMVLLPEALAAMYQQRKGTDTMEEARELVQLAGWREDL